ncbi:hypothetical protein BCO_0900006 [Borrelia coriaceae ATCC 43381]|uniref:Uncharacterized protein n=1 Tax=Borrelia coriaceae ATCC 43381 TaxID=1408429 RepID=W5SZL7_9SPIR|nr:hypothetical protein BCO_0900006 [Borrelia coriaceae ATCC 43381]
MPLSFITSFFMLSMFLFISSAFVVEILESEFFLSSGGVLHEIRRRANTNSIENSNLLFFIINTSFLCDIDYTNQELCFLDINFFIFA